MKAATLALNRSLPGFRGSRRVREAFPSLGMAAAVREVWATKAAWFKRGSSKVLRLMIQILHCLTVEARKLEHHYPHALKVKYKGS